MKKKIVSLLTVSLLALSMISCANALSSTRTDISEDTDLNSEDIDLNSEDTDLNSEDADLLAARHVAEMIDAIYVKKRTEDTDNMCIDAKKAWNALTDRQKTLVKGKYADPDYFGRDTGDASLDDPRNQDDIGEKEILAVSFGTSFNDSRVKDIKGIEDALAEAYPDWSVRRAFTSQIIINHIQARDGEAIDNVEQAIDRALANGVKNLVIQPTHLMHGTEYDEMCETLDNYIDKFENISVAEPLLGEVGEDASVVNEDKAAVSEAIIGEAVKTAAYESLEAASEDAAAFVFMGHGTSHTAKVTYSQMQTQMENSGYDNVFIATVEGEPEETSCENVLAAVKEAGYKKVILRPLMLVAGDHANNDMAGEDQDSWQSIFTASGEFESVDTQISGLGRIKEIKDIYIAHTGEVINQNNKPENFLENESDETVKESIKDLRDGLYKAVFTTDSSMFHVNETQNDKGILSVENGKASIHIVLSSKNIVNLYPGTADRALKDEKRWLQPVQEEVTYQDGMTETVNAFDVPVPYLNREFDLALVGTKAIWYDHKVTVSDPVPYDEKEINVKTDIQDSPTEGLKVTVSLEGGSGKAGLDSPAQVKKKDGAYTVTLCWNSPYYDYMIVDDVKYLPVNTDGNSIFEIPVSSLDTELKVKADTIKMSQPHEIEYTVILRSAD